MKLATITPTRGDRAEFLQQALRLIGMQTRQPNEVIVVDDRPLGEGIDIAWRYKKGCEEAVKRGCDLLFFWEDDDYYHPRYVAAMVKAYERCHPRPFVFGIEMTVYYHLRLRQFGMFYHAGQASAMTTAITAEAVNRFPWPDDALLLYDVKHGRGFFDRVLWDWAKKEGVGKTVLFRPDFPLAIGMKHGIGKCGGSHHDTNEKEWLIPLKQKDPDLQWLRKHVFPEAFEFYERLSASLNQKNS